MEQARRYYGGNVPAHIREAIDRHNRIDYQPTRGQRIAAWTDEWVTSVDELDRFETRDEALNHATATYGDEWADRDDVSVAVLSPEVAAFYFLKPFWFVAMHK